MDTAHVAGGMAIVALAILILLRKGFANISVS